MRVGIDLTVAQVNQAGTGIYARSLAEAIARLGTVGAPIIFAGARPHEMGRPRTIGSRLETLYRDLVWTHVVLPRRVARAGVDLLHMPANVLPLRLTCPGVVSILDTTVFDYAHTFKRWHRLYYQRLIPLSARRAARVITISQHSKQDLVHHCGIDPERIVVTHLAAAPHFRPVPPAQAAAVAARYGLGRYVLAVGTLEPRKNFTRLLEAFAELRRQGFDGTLAHAGPEGWLDQSREVAQRLGLGDVVRFLGRVPVEDLVGLYNGAALMAYPSLYEGFGLPVLEAMACGCPVVTSDRSSLPEVTGNAALLVDPTSVAAIAGAMGRLLDDAHLAAELRECGLRRAASFSWERCAHETVEAYRSALSGAA